MRSDFTPVKQPEWNKENKSDNIPLQGNLFRVTDYSQNIWRTKYEDPGNTHQYGEKSSPALVYLKNQQFGKFSYALIVYRL